MKNNPWIIIKYPPYLLHWKWTPTKCCNYLKTSIMWIYHRVMHPKDTAGMANSVDPAQTAPLAVRSGCTLFAKTCLSRNLGSLPFFKVFVGDLLIHKWATSWWNQKMTALSESDQPGHPPSLIRVFADLCTQWVPKDPSFLHVDSEDTNRSDWADAQVIWVFAGCTVILLVLSWHSWSILLKCVLVLFKSLSKTRS